MKTTTLKNDLFEVFAHLAVIVVIVAAVMVG